MKPALARDVSVRREWEISPVVFVGVLCLAAGVLIGDWTADRRFEERAASIIDYVTSKRDEVERLRESLKRGCYDYTMKKKEM